MEKNRKLITVLMCCAFQGCVLSSLDNANRENPSPRFESEVSLFSWVGGDGRFHYALERDANLTQFIRQFDRRKAYIATESELEAQLSKLPRGSRISWRDERYYGIVYPPAVVFNRIASIAKKLGLSVHKLPTLYDGYQY